MNSEQFDPQEVRAASVRIERESVPTAGEAEDIGNAMSSKDSARLRRIADDLLWRAFTRDKGEAK